MLYFKFRFFLFYVLLFLLLNVNYVVTQLITASIISSVALGGWFSWDTIEDNTVCRFWECCNDKHVPYNLSSKFTFQYLNDCRSILLL